jgi:hypothetical protein
MLVLIKDEGGTWQKYTLVELYFSRYRGFHQGGKNEVCRVPQDSSSINLTHIAILSCSVK